MHSRGVGDGSFPNSYPNEAVPLTGVVHIPNVLDPPDNPADPEFMAKLLGLDNAFAVPLSQEIAGEEEEPSKIFDYQCWRVQCPDGHLRNVINMLKMANNSLFGGVVFEDACSHGFVSRCIEEVAEQQTTLD